MNEHSVNLIFYKFYNNFSKNINISTLARDFNSCMNYIIKSISSCKIQIKIRTAFTYILLISGVLIIQFNP